MVGVCVTFKHRNRLMDPHDCHFEGWLKTPSAQGPEIFFHSWQSSEVRSKTSAIREPYRTTFVNLWTMIQADSLLLSGMNCDCCVFFPAAVPIFANLCHFLGGSGRHLGSRPPEDYPTWPPILPFGSAHVCLKLLASCGYSLAWGHFSIPQKAKPAGRSWHCWGHLENAHFETHENPWKSTIQRKSTWFYMIQILYYYYILYIMILIYNICRSVNIVLITPVKHKGNINTAEVKKNVWGSINFSTTNCLIENETWVSCCDPFSIA